MHVVDATALFGGDFADVAEIEKALTESGRKILEKAGSSSANAGVPSETRLLEMDRFSQRVADMVAGEAKSRPADLVVIGTHGRRGISHLFLGSVAEAVARVSPVPVLLVRAR